MSNPNSVLTELMKAIPNRQLGAAYEPSKKQMYFKSSLTALSHAMEDQILAGKEQPLVIASFQRERFYRQEAHRYRRIANLSKQVYVLAAPETDFKHNSDIYETIAFEPTDGLAQEWHLVVISKSYANCLICRERTVSVGDNAGLAMDNSRRFEGIWTFDPTTSKKAAAILLKRILAYRPELAAKIRQAEKQYLQAERKELEKKEESQNFPMNNPDPFVQRLVTYLQAGQYKLLKVNRSLMAKEKKERLVNHVTMAIRRSLDPDEIMQLAVQKLGEGLRVCRCIVYRCQENDVTATIKHEFLNEGIDSIKGSTWPLKNNPLFQKVVELREALSIDNALKDPRIQDKEMQKQVQSCAIVSWLLVPVLYQGKLLGMVELHHCDMAPTTWKTEDIALVDAIATQVGVALIQAEAYANLQDLNEQLEALDRTRSNLVAITGHELRTPLSTIQVCLESLASEPDMSLELRQVMLNTALTDAERMRKLVQDFLTLSQLESGRIEWNMEPISLSECIELALSHVRSRTLDQTLPQITNQIPPDLPLVQADGEWLVEVLTKLLDNACKFTDKQASITIEVKSAGGKTLEVTIADTGRGIEPNRLEKVFDRFYQEEGALRRSTGGTGLGLAICRQIVNGWGGAIWAESAGKNQGSQFHFTLPIASEVEPPVQLVPKTPTQPQKSRKTSKKKR